MQHIWKNEIPETKENFSDRVNLTFRQIAKE
jgi:hypothetical protein